MIEANEYVAAVFATLLTVAVDGYNDTPEQSAARTWMEHIQAVESRSELGKASIFDKPQKLACGGRLDRRTMIEHWAAHPSLPCWTRVEVTSLDTGKSVEVTIVDRGPYVVGRIIDLTPGAAKAIGLTKKQGVVPVRITWKPLNQKPPELIRRRRR